VSDLDVAGVAFGRLRRDADSGPITLVDAQPEINDFPRIETNVRLRPDRVFGPADAESVLKQCQRRRAEWVRLHSGPGQLRDPALVQIIQAFPVLRIIKIDV